MQDGRRNSTAAGSSTNASREDTGKAPVGVHQHTHPSNNPIHQGPYRHGSHLLECPFPPCVINKPLFATLQFLRVMRSRRRFTHHPTGQLEQTSRPVKRDATVIFHIETIKCPGEILSIGIDLYLRSARAGLS